MQMTAVASSSVEAVKGSSGALAEWIALTDGWPGAAVAVRLSGGLHQVCCRVEGSRVLAEVTSGDLLTSDEVDALVSCGWLAAESSGGWYRSWLRAETSPEAVVEDMVDTLCAMHLARASCVEVEVGAPGA